MAVEMDFQAPEPRINHDKRGRKKRQEALETAAEALQIFVEINDRRFEARNAVQGPFSKGFDAF